MGIFDDWNRVPGDPMDEEKRRLEEEQRQQARARSSIFSDWGPLTFPEQPQLDMPIEQAPVPEMPIQGQVLPDMSQPSPDLMAMLGGGPQPMQPDAMSLGDDALRELQARVYLQQLIDQTEASPLAPTDPTVPQMPYEPVFDPMAEALGQAPVQADTGPVVARHPDEAPIQQAPASIGPGDPFAMEDALAQEELVASLSGPERAAVEFANQVNQGAGMFNKAARTIYQKTRGDEEYLDRAEDVKEISGAIEGTWEKVGGLGGAFAGPMVDIMALHGIAGAAAPLFQSAGYARTAKFLNTIAKDPTQNWMEGNKIGALKSLLAEELPFISADVLEGNDLKTIMQHAVQGVILGGGAEATIGRALGRTVPDLEEPKPRAPEPDVPEPVVRPKDQPVHEAGLASGEVTPDLDRRVADVGAPEGGERRGVVEAGRDLVAGGLERISRGVETERRAAQRTTEGRFGLQNEEALNAARPAVDADPDRGFVYGDISNLHGLNKPFGEDAADDALRALTEPLREKYGAQVFKPGGDEIVIAARKEDLPAIAEEMKQLFPDQSVRQALGEGEPIRGQEGFLDQTTGIDVGYGDTFEAANRAGMEIKAGRPKQARKLGADEPPAEPFHDPDQLEMEAPPELRPEEPEPVFVDPDSAREYLVSLKGDAGRRVDDVFNEAEASRRFEDASSEEYDDFLMNTAESFYREAEALEAPVRAEEPDRAPVDIEDLPDASVISKNMIESDPGNPVTARKAVESGVADDMAPDELRHTLGIQALDDAVDSFSRSSLGKVIRGKLRVAGDVSKRVFNRKFDEDSVLKARAWAMNERATRVASRLADKYGIEAMTELGGLPADVQKAMEIAVGSRRGWSVDMPIDKETFKELRELRIESDLLISQMKKENLVHGQLKLSMSERGSSYLMRGYRAFKKGDDWAPDAERTNDLINWAQDFYGMDEAKAMEFAGKLRNSGDLNEALGQVAKRNQEMERAQLRLGTSAEAAGSTKVLSGFVPRNVRNKIEGLIGERGGKTRKAIDDFINREKQGEQGIIDMLEGQRQKLIREMSDPEYAGPLKPEAFQGQIDAIERSIDDLWRRLEIPEPVRRFFGEEDNPLVRIMDTVERQGQIVAGARVAKSVIDVGVEKGTVKPMNDIIKEGLDPKDYVKIGSKDFKLAGVLPETLDVGRDLYLDREILAALNDRFTNIRPGEQGMATRIFQRMNHFIKGNLTFRNPGTHGRNFFGAKLFEAASGLAHPANFKTQVQRLRKSASAAAKATSFAEGKLSDASMKEVRDLMERGLIDKSVFERGFADNLKELADAGDIDTWATGFRKQQLGDVVGLKKLKEWDAKAQEVYRMEDDIARVVIYLGETDEMTTAVARGVDVKTFNRVYGSDLTDLGEESIKDLAAKIARDTYPNYEMLGRGVQDLRRNPILSSFPSFAAEVLRTSKNQIKFATAELSTPGLRGRGMKRLWGITQVAIGPPMAASAMAKANGMSSEELDALRRDQGDYQRFNTIIPLHKNADGSVNYMDMGYMEPHGLIRSVWNALADGVEREGHLGDAANFRNAIGQAFGELSDPFAQQEIIFGAFLELVQNWDKWGQRVWDGDEWSKDMTGHLLKRFEPGVSKPLRRTVNALQGEMASNKTTPAPWMEAGEFIGFRIRQSNPRQEYDWRLGRTKDRVVAADDDLIRLIRDLNDVDEQELRKTYDQFEDRRKRAILDGGIATMDTRYRGNPEQNIEHSLRSMGLDKEERESIRLGVYVPKEFGPTFQDRLKTDFVRQALSKEDAERLWAQVEQRVTFLRQLSKERRAEGIQEYEWER